MRCIRAIELSPGLLVHHIDVVRTLAMMVTIGLAFVTTGGLVLSIAVRTSIAPEFYGQIALNAQQSLAIHNGLSPTCAFSPNPPQHDCFQEVSVSECVSEVARQVAAWSQEFWRAPQTALECQRLPSWIDRTPLSSPQPRILRFQLLQFALQRSRANAACRLHAVFGSAPLSNHRSSAISNASYRHKLQ